MEQILLWVTIFGVIIIPIAGWIFNSLITRKIDDGNKKDDELEEKIEACEKKNHEFKGLIFAKLDIHKLECEKIYVRSDINNEKFHNLEEKTDSKISAHMLLLQKEFQYIKEALEKLTKQIDRKD